MSAAAAAPLWLRPLGAVYGWAAARRRARYHRHPHLQKALTRPVVSVGNLSVGGSGKTPLVAALATLLLDMGERPAVLSRGYRRQSGPAGGQGVLVVSDARGVRASVEESGDEPQLLARRLAGIPVLVAADRYEAGRVAERDFGCTVHVLDDGFQHLRLARDLDVLLLGDRDLCDHVLPAGRLREPLAAAWDADLWLTPDGDPARLAYAPALVAARGTLGAAVGAAVSVPPSFRVALNVGAPRFVAPFGQAAQVVPGRAVAVAGIARPERFFASAREAGWTIEREMVFADHHWFTAGDWRKVRAAAEAAGVATVLTTEKDAVRLERIVAGEPAGMHVCYLPIDLVLGEALEAWLRTRLAERAA
ncbi:MAG: tetraacyldisaccharide 4'-kinase [Vicinamibacterales bacterium]